MQDVQNIPNPDVNIIEDDGDFGSHSDRDAPDTDVEQPERDAPSDRDQPSAPMVEPPDEDGEAPGDRNIIGLN